MIRAWILNLDADDEIATGARRDPFAAIERRPSLRDDLAPLVAGDVVLSRGQRAPRGAVGRAFSPTPSALAALARAGAVPPSAPPLDVLRRVADRRFALALPGGVPGAAAIERIDDAVAAVAALGAGEAGWVVKRLFGFAGRGRLLRRGSELDENARHFVARAIAEDGAAIIEPWLDRRADLAIHGHVSADGAVTLGRPTLQETTAAGAWIASRAAVPGDLRAGEEEALAALAADAALALRTAGAFGPFGLDAMRVLLGGAQILVRCEVNPRYTMGWAVGMGPVRPDRRSASPEGGPGGSHGG